MVRANAGDDSKASTRASDERALVVVGVDGSSGANLALTWSAGYAFRTASRLAVVGACAGRRPNRAFSGDEAGQVVADATEKVLLEHPRMAVEARVVTGSPARALVEASSDADLLVVGSRGSGGFLGLRIGSVSQHCPAHAGCSVAVVRPAEHEGPSGAGPSGKTIVVGVDGSGSSTAALDWATAEARRTRARLSVIAALTFPATSAFTFIVELGIADAPEQIAREALERVNRAAPDVSGDGWVTRDPAGIALVDASRHADLLVVGSGGTGAFGGLLLGSIAQFAATHAHCPVVAVRPCPSETKRDPERSAPPAPG